MSINPKCDSCKRELTKFGALLFSPPKGTVVKKFHLCQDCYKKVIKSFGPKSTR